MAHEHGVIDQDRRFVIDPDTMTITATGTVKPLKRGDHRAEKYGFSMPRYIEGHDMSLCNKVEVHYNNLHYDPKTRETTTNSSFDGVEGFGISATDENTVEWVWSVAGDATQLDGTLNFCMRFACMNGDKIEYQKFSDIFESIQVGESIWNTEEMAKAYADVLEAWRQELLVAIENGGAVKTVNGVAPDADGNVEIVIPDSSQNADWNQNDPTAPDYVKNRPFYSENVVATVTQAFDGLTAVVDVEFCATLIEKRAEAKYTVNGVECIYLKDVNVTDTFCSYQISDGAATYFVVGDASGNDGVDTIKIITGGGSLMPATVSFVAETEIVKKLDEKYLPGNSSNSYVLGVGDGVVTIGKYEEAVSAFLNGCAVFIKPDDSAYLRVISLSDEVLTAMRISNGINIANGSNRIGIYQVTSGAAVGYYEYSLTENV